MLLAYAVYISKAEGFKSTHNRMRKVQDNGCMNYPSLITIAHTLTHSNTCTANISEYLTNMSKRYVPLKIELKIWRVGSTGKGLAVQARVQHSPESELSLTCIK